MSDALRWAAPATTARSRRRFRRPADHSEVAWLPRYRIEVGVAASSDEDAVWEVWLCGLDGTLCCRGGIRAALLHADTLKPQRVPASLFEEKQT